MQVVLEDGDYAATAATFVPQQDIKEDIPVTNDDLPTYLSKQQQKGCVVFEGVADEREIENTCRELRIPLRHCRLEGA